MCKNLVFCDGQNKLCTQVVTDNKDFNLHSKCNVLKTVSPSPPSAPWKSNDNSDNSPTPYFICVNNCIQGTEISLPFSPSYVAL